MHAVPGREPAWVVLVRNEENSTTKPHTAYWVQQTQQKWTASTLPSMSAVFVQGSTVYYAAGRSLGTLQSSTAEPLFPPPGVRHGALVVLQSSLAVAAVAQTFYLAHIPTKETQTIVTFPQSVHAPLAIALDHSTTEDGWFTVFVASGRSCAVVDLHATTLQSHARGIVTVAAPILAAVSSGPLVVWLASDGLVSLRSPACLGVPLQTIEVGTRPNEYFGLHALPDRRCVVASGTQAKVLTIEPDRDVANRLLKHAVDALGTVPHLAEALGVKAVLSGSGMSPQLLTEYLLALLGLEELESGAHDIWPMAEEPPLLVASALLCWKPPNAALANKAAQQACKLVLQVEPPVRAFVTSVADKLLKDAAAQFSLLSNQNRRQVSAQTELLEAAVWLLRACGEHERSMDVAYKRLRQPAGEAGRGLWSRMKFDSYMATHLSELWGCGDERGKRIVLQNEATHRLLEMSPPLGLSVFAASHPQNAAQWQAMDVDPLSDDMRPKDIVQLLLSIQPIVPTDKEYSKIEKGDLLPLSSGRALAVAFLESAIGIESGRQVVSNVGEEDGVEWTNRMSDFHDELTFLLLEGVISERRDDQEGDVDSDLGQIYRSKLRRLLQWKNAMIRPHKLMDALPSSFLQEKALVLGRMGRHEDALKILYHDLKSLDLALEYCDNRHAQHGDATESRGRRLTEDYVVTDDEDLFDEDEDNAYLPLIRVALDSDKDAGTAVAIQILARRRASVDRAAALRLLPSDVPVSAIARPFLIPALVESESQVRRLTVVSALLRARYVRLKSELTSAQLKAQASLPLVPQLRPLSLGDPLHSSKAFRARTSTTNSNMPDVMIVKHFFPGHLVIQAKVTNSVGLKHRRTLVDVAFVVAESSDDAIQPILQVPLQTLPPQTTGSAWCVLQAGRMDGTAASLTCELRYTVQAEDASLLGPVGRSYVEELQDLEIQAAHFS